MEPD